MSVYVSLHAGAAAALTLSFRWSGDVQLGPSDFLLRRVMHIC